MALIQRGKDNLDDLIISGTVIFADWELTQNDTTSAFEINNNGTNAISIDDGTQKVNMSGALAVLGNTTLSGTVITQGASTLSGNVSITAGNDLVVDGTTFIVDSANNRVGIGTLSPTTVLEVTSGSPTLNITATTGNANLQITSIANNQSFIDFADAGADFNGRIIYNNSTDQFNIHTNASTTSSMLLQSTGNLRIYSTDLVGTSALSIRKNNTNTNNQSFIDFIRSSTSTTNGTSEGNLGTDGSSSLGFTDISSRKYKKNIIENTDGYNLMKSLRSVKFDWIDDAKPNNCLGFIAEEVEQIYPRATGMVKVRGEETDEEGNITQELEEGLGVNKLTLVPIMWSCIKTLIAKVEALEQR